MKLGNNIKVFAPKTWNIKIAPITAMLCLEKYFAPVMSAFLPPSTMQSQNIIIPVLCTVYDYHVTWLLFWMIIFQIFTHKLMFTRKTNLLMSDKHEITQSKTIEGIHYRNSSRKSHNLSSRWTAVLIPSMTVTTRPDPKMDKGVERGWSRGVSNDPWLLEKKTLSSNLLS